KIWAGGATDGWRHATGGGRSGFVNRMSGGRSRESVRAVRTLVSEPKQHVPTFCLLPTKPHDHHPPPPPYLKIPLHPLHRKPPRLVVWYGSCLNKNMHFPETLISLLLLLRCRRRRSSHRRPIRDREIQGRLQRKKIRHG
ncbi:hypothetical protein ACLOJK_007258, partial [Asimina triloba]